MNNFIYDIPTKVYFGKNQIQHLPEMVHEFGKRVLLCYGSGSIKKFGLYDQIISLFENNNIIWMELSDIEPNPRIETVRKGVDLMRKHHLDCLVAVGGGSTLDCAKAIAIATDSPHDAWDLIIDTSKITDARPLITVLTLAATGSEMDNCGVISHLEYKRKKGFAHQFAFPKYSILDPTYTFTVSPYQTASGTADIMSHIIESYFDQVKDAMIQDGISVSLLKACIHYAPIALKEPDNYEARANLMWAATLGINGLNSLGKNRAWSCHAMEHTLSAYYDITHGAGLAMLTPRWMKHILNEQTEKDFARFGLEVFHLSSDCKTDHELALESIQALYDFFVSLGLPMTLAEFKIDESKLEEMAEATTVQNPKLANAYVPLTQQDILTIYQMCKEPLSCK